MSIQFTPDTPATRRAFNRLAREKMKLRLLADIRMDLMVCEFEGWEKLEYLDELLALVQELRKKGGKMDSTLKDCKLVKVIQVVTKEGTGAKENPIRESIAYFTTDGVYIGTLVNGVQK